MSRYYRLDEHLAGRWWRHLQLSGGESPYYDSRSEAEAARDEHIEQTGADLDSFRVVEVGE